jgi:hypothetical protein
LPLTLWIALSATFTPNPSLYFVQNLGGQSLRAADAGEKLNFDPAHICFEDDPPDCGLESGFLLFRM